jgi:hypothetical protein
MRILLLTVTVLMSAGAITTCIPTRERCESDEDCGDDEVCLDSVDATEDEKGSCVKEDALS